MSIACTSLHWDIRQVLAAVLSLDPNKSQVQQQIMNPGQWQLLSHGTWTSSQPPRSDFPKGSPATAHAWLTLTYLIGWTPWSHLWLYLGICVRFSQMVILKPSVFRKHHEHTQMEPYFHIFWLLLVDGSLCLSLLGELEHSLGTRYEVSVLWVCSCSNSVAMIK